MQLVQQFAPCWGYMLLKYLAAYSRDEGLASLFCNIYICHHPPYCGCWKTESALIPFSVFNHTHIPRLCACNVLGMHHLPVRMGPAKERPMAQSHCGA